MLSINHSFSLTPSHSNPTLETWLDHIGPPKSGRILAESPTKRETKRPGEILDKEFKHSEGLPKNALRHTFLTYSAAIRKDLPAIVFEAGTSISKLNSNYVEASDEKQLKSSSL